MSGCVTEPELVALATGDGTAAVRAHAAACDACATRLSALERDLSQLRHALERPPARLAARRRPWIPLAAAAALSTALLVVALAPLRSATPAGTDTAAASELDEALSRALFADAGFAVDDEGSDDRALAAALNGGALCGGGYGDDCSTALLLAGYD
jgi:hypothetical protein